jgi:hypothetical protein
MYGTYVGVVRHKYTSHGKRDSRYKLQQLVHIESTRNDLLNIIYAIMRTRKPVGFETCPLLSENVLQKTLYLL